MTALVVMGSMLFGTGGDNVSVSSREGPLLRCHVFEMPCLLICAEKASEFQKVSVKIIITLTIVN